MHVKPKTHHLRRWIRASRIFGTGIDVQKSKADKVNRGESYIPAVPSEILRPLVEANKFAGTSEFSVIRGLDTINCSSRSDDP